jgi:hypothetical protein
MGDVITFPKGWKTPVVNIIGLIWGCYWFGPWFLLPAFLVGMRFVRGRNIV